LILRQRADSIAEAAKIDPHRYLPVHINRGQLRIIFLLLVGNSLIIWRGEAQFQIALREHQFQQAVEQEINQIEEIRDSIASDETLTSVQGQTLLQPLDDAIQALSQAGSREQAISILTEAKARLEALANPSEQQLTDNLSQLGEGLSQQEGTPLEAFGQQLSNGKLPEASQELERLDLSQLSADQAQALAAQLEESAQALESSHPPLADALAHASESLRSDEIGSASEALRQASEELRQTAGQNAQNQVARSAVNKIAAAEERLIAAGQSASDQSSSQTGELSSTSVEEARANGESSSQASGSSSQTGGESSGNDAGRGEGDGDSIPGSEVGSSPISQDNHPGDSGLQPYEMIYSPQRLGGDAGELLSLPEGSFAGDQMMGQGLTSSGENSPPRVPYVDVYQHYAEIYRQALQSGAVPPAFRALVRKYFSSLEP
jgi:hypothetical protein